MSPVLAAAPARAEAADADLVFDARVARAPRDVDAAGPPLRRSVPEVAPSGRVSKTPGQFSWVSGFLGHSTQLRGGRRS
ncbi:hypothetical protein QE418_001015 [Microbacterium testaceum]|nr:hypothetical protein [Microbacterium testaceum]MDR6097898.1 hypothetical protein [Microbacterium sp. SORGH_AS_0454]